MVFYFKKKKKKKKKKRTSNGIFFIRYSRIWEYGVVDNNLQSINCIFPKTLLLNLEISLRRSRRRFSGT